MDKLKNIFSNSKAKSKKSKSNQNFEEIKDIPGELRNRDVYVDQQFERGEMEKPRSNTSNIVISSIAGFFAFLFSLFILGLISYLIGGFNSNFRGEKSDLSNREARRSSYSEKNSSDRFNGKDLNFDDTVDVKGKAGSYDVEVDGDLGDKPSLDYKGGYHRGKIYYEEKTIIDPMTGMHTKYFQLDENGNRVSDKAYDMISEIPVPSWYEELHPEIAKGKGPNANVNIKKNQGDLNADINGRDGSKSNANLDGSKASGKNNQGLSDKGLRRSNLADNSVMHHITHPTIKRFLLSLIIGLAVGGTLYEYLYRILKAENAMTETTDINPYKNDQHIALPQELQRQLDWFPDVGAKSSAQPSTLMSHMHLENKGIKPVIVPMRYKEDIVDEDGDIVHYKSEVIYNDNGKMQAKKMPLFDTKFSDALFETSGADRKYWIRYDTTKIPYNPGNKNIEKLKGYDTVSDLINRDWDLPYYEVQRPAGAYLVDTAPVNTMMLAITRAGKGQTYIEPMLDMWTREKNYNNMVVNDPKGELLVKFYERATVRGFEVVQFNLINSIKTNIYNPLSLAAQSAREGDFNKCAQYVENIADVFFPLDGGDDPVWPNAANNAVRDVVY